MLLVFFSGGYGFKRLGLNISIKMQAQAQDLRRTHHSLISIPTGCVQGTSCKVLHGLGRRSKEAAISASLTWAPYSGFGVSYSLFEPLGILANMPAKAFLHFVDVLRDVRYDPEFRLPRNLASQDRRQRATSPRTSALTTTCSRCPQGEIVSCVSFDAEAARSRARQLPIFLYFI